VRENIDPFSEHGEAKISSVLKRVGLNGYEDSDPHHLSFGERQLLQLARTLLRNVSIIVMDEPTSNIDPNTDASLQRAVREEFGDRTVMTIAHRLETVIDYDIMLVLDAGKVAECGPPAKLLQDPNGMFSTMLSHQGASKAARLSQRVLGSPLAKDVNDDRVEVSI